MKLFFIYSSDNRVFRYNAGLSRPRMLIFLRGGVTYCTIFIGNFTASCFLKKIELLTLVCSQLSVCLLLVSLRECWQSSLSWTICCIEQSPAGGSIFYKLLLSKATVRSFKGALLVLFIVAECLLRISSLFSISVWSLTFE